MNTKRLVYGAISLSLTVMAALPNAQSAVAAGRMLPHIKPASLLWQVRDVLSRALNIAALSPAAPSECDGNDITLLTGDAPPVTVTIEQVQVSNESDDGCDVIGKLHITIPENDVTDIDVSGQINAEGKFFSTNVGAITLNLAGLTLRTDAQPTDASVRAFEDDELRLYEAEIAVPESWGGASLRLPITPKITSAGLVISPNKFKIPSIVTKIVGIGLDVGIEYNQQYGRYELWGGGQFGIAGLVATISKVECYIAVSARVFYVPDSRAAKVEFASAGMEPASWKAQVRSPASTAGTIGLQNASLTIAGNDKGCAIPLDPETFTIWLYKVSGTIALAPEDSSLSFLVSIGTNPKLVELEGSTQLQWSPELMWKVAAKLKVLYFFEVASAEVSISESRGIEGKATVRTQLSLMRLDLAFRAFPGPQKQQVLMTGSGEVTFGWRKGEFGQICGPQIATDILKTLCPAQETCEKPNCGIFNFVCKVGCKVVQAVTCNACVSLPPTDDANVRATTEVGAFNNGNVYGFKGYATIPWVNIRKGFFWNANNNQLSWGDVDQYQLANPTTAARALAAYRDLQAGKPVRLSDVDGAYAFPDDHTVVVQAPTIVPWSKGAVSRSPLSPQDAITSTSVMTVQDTLFQVQSTKDMVMSLVAPDDANTEITPDNYESLAPTYNVSYSQMLTYEVPHALDRSKSRLSYVPMAASPTLAHVDVKVDGSAVFTNVWFTDTARTAYAYVTPGRHTVAVVPVGAAQPALTNVFTTLQATDYSVMALGDNAGASELVVITDTNMAPNGLGQARLRVINTAATTAPNASVYIDGALKQSSLTYKSVSAYFDVAAGKHTVQLKSGATVLATRDITMSVGNVYSVFAFEATANGTNYVTDMSEAIDEFYSPVTVTEFTVLQAPKGNWQVRLTGDITDTGWVLGVVGIPNPPVLSDVSFDPSDPQHPNVSMLIKSDYLPVKVSYFIKDPAVTSTLTFTDDQGLEQTEDVIYLDGQPADVVTLTQSTEVDGSTPFQHTVDLSNLETDRYRMYVRVEDGKSPAVETFVAAAGGPSARTMSSREVRVNDLNYRPYIPQDDADVITIDNSGSFMSSFGSVTPGIAYDVPMWYYDENDELAFDGYAPMVITWTADMHPDVDRYVVYLDTHPLNPGTVLSTTEVISDGIEIVPEYDEFGDIVSEYYQLSYEDVEPDTTYYAYVEAMDDDWGDLSAPGRAPRDSGLSEGAPSAVAVGVIQQGSFGLIRHSSLVTVSGNVTFTVGVTRSDNLYGDIMMGVDVTEPAGLYADVLTDPTEPVPPAPGLRAPADTTIEAVVAVTATSKVPRGRYTLPIYATDGSMDKVVYVDVFVLSRVFVPILRKR
jgi:hypothetical protein